MKISVVIPVKNEADSIRDLLDALLNQTLPPDQILVTDGGSIDGTLAILKDYDRLHSSIHVFPEAGAMPGRGRNVGAANAANEWIAFIDAGVTPASNWLEELAKCAVQDEHVDVVFGTWQPVTDTLFTECAAIAYAYVP